MSTTSTSTNEEIIAAAKSMLQTFPTAVLAAAARGEIDLNALAKGELANRGVDTNGKWVGFRAANKLHR